MILRDITKRIEGDHIKRLFIMQAGDEYPSDPGALVLYKASSGAWKADLDGMKMTVTDKQLVELLAYIVAQQA
jgi:hypothetical protein